MNDTKTKKYHNLFMPSGMGLVFYTFFSGMIIFLNQLSFIQEYLQIPREINFIRIFTNFLDTVLVSTIGQSNTETFVVGLFWAFVGLGVYLFLLGVARFVMELSESMEERNYKWPAGTNRNQTLIEAAQRTVVRIMAFILFTFVLLGPLAHLVDAPAFVDFIGPNRTVQVIFWFVFLWLMMHVSVVLLRLAALKPRLFD